LTLLSAGPNMSTSTFTPRPLDRSGGFQFFAAACMLVVMRASCACACASHVCSPVPGPAHDGSSRGRLAWTGAVAHTMRFRMARGHMHAPACERHMQQRRPAY
jgi:hypothetical protein